MTIETTLSNKQKIEGGALPSSKTYGGDRPHASRLSRKKGNWIRSICGRKQDLPDNLNLPRKTAVFRDGIHNRSLKLKDFHMLVRVLASQCEVAGLPKHKSRCLLPTSESRPPQGVG